MAGDDVTQGGRGGGEGANARDDRSQGVEEQVVVVAAGVAVLLSTLYSTKQCVMAGCDGQAKVDVLMDWW